MSRQNTTAAVDTTEELFQTTTLTNADFNRIRGWVVSTLTAEGCDRDTVQAMVNAHRTIQRAYSPLLALYLDQESKEKKAAAKEAVKKTADFILGRSSTTNESPW